MSKNELINNVLGKNLTIQEALILAFRCGRDEQGETTEKEMLEILIPKVHA